MRGSRFALCKYGGVGILVVVCDSHYIKRFSGNMKTREAIVDRSRKAELLAD